MESVILGLSDGVDSAVAALLLKKTGYHVIGLFLDTHGKACAEDARKSAEKLGIDFLVQDASDALEREIITPFAKSYLAGKTPSPCVWCNPLVKIKALLDTANAMGIEKIATGHYSVCDGGNIYTGQPDCDQSYMLSRLTSEMVRRLLLPLGTYRKEDVRQIARQHGISVADKPDSRENCFITGMPYWQWLEQRETTPGEGAVYFRGKQVGTHMGIHRYTVGQRWEQDMGDRRAYVAQINAADNALVLGLWEELFTNRVELRDLTWITTPPESTFRGIIRVRHTRWEMPECAVSWQDDHATVQTDSPLRAPAPGQAAALYDGNRLLGGGTIV